MEINPRNAFWRDLPTFNRYVARVQSAMQEGIADADVLMYWPIWDNWHDASRWPVRPSGLSGPVTLQPLSGDVPSAAR